MGRYKDSTKKRAAERKYVERNRDKVNKDHARWVLENPTKYMLSQIRHRAKQRGLDCNLELSDLIIPKECPYLKVPLTTVGIGNRTKSVASIDRIDSSKGYIKGNIEIISYLANRMKSDSTKEELIAFAKSILNKHASISN